VAGDGSFGKGCFSLGGAAGGLLSASGEAATLASITWSSGWMSGFFSIADVSLGRHAAAIGTG